MTDQLKRRFKARAPRAIVLDDDQNSRAMTARTLRRRGFEAFQCANIAEFLDVWGPGLFDVIIADWELSSTPSEHGEHVLASVRTRDWDVPFVLISGRLTESKQRADVLARLLENGGAKFVERGPSEGQSGIETACDCAQQLIERRDLALVRLILRLRPGALSGAAIATTAGQRPVTDILAEVVSSPNSSLEADEPVAEYLAGHGRRE